MKVSQLAINTVSTRQSSLEEALEAYAAAGFRQVEFQLGHLKDWLALGHTVADVGVLLATYGLHCIGGFQARSLSSVRMERTSFTIVVANG